MKSDSRRKSPSKPQKHQEHPVRFFERQLAGEEPLSGATAGHLYEVSRTFTALQPWTFMGDRELVLVKSPASAETWYCSVMGGLGEVFALYVYIGDESYRGLGKVLAGGKVSPGEFFATNRGVSVEFVRAGDLTPPDRELLRHFKHPSRSEMAPIFRALRPGYHPWYVTEPEGTILAQCLRAVAALCDTLLQQPDLQYWQEKDLYPLLIPIGDDGAQPRFQVQQVRAPVPAGVASVPPARLEAETEARLARILETDYVVAGILEAGCAFPRAVVGEASQRKAIVPVAIVAEASSGFLYPPELGKPGQAIGEVLLCGVLNAIEHRKQMPHELRVRPSDFGFNQPLEAAAQRLGIGLTTAKSLPEFNRAQKHLLAMMEGR